MTRTMKSQRRHNRQLFRATALLFVLLCVLISCPVKRELRALLLPVSAAAQTGIPQPALPPAAPLQLAEEAALSCAVQLENLLEEAENAALGQQVAVVAPLLWLAVTLASLYLMLASPARKVFLRHAFAGAAQAAGVPLFLRYRQLVI